ncbi:MAG: type II secretion system protein GspG [Myxococcota bacterium]
MRDARARIAAIERELAEVHALTGAYPDALRDLGWRLAGQGGVDGANADPGLDPWGRAWTYRADDAGYALASAGPDGVDGTDDDVLGAGPARDGASASGS